MDECITKEMTKSLLKAFEGMNESLEDFQKACASTIESTEKHIVSALFLENLQCSLNWQNLHLLHDGTTNISTVKLNIIELKQSVFSIKISSNMLGAIIGDIVGSRFEFNNTDNYNFELFTKDSTFTDDTICTIAVADAINTGVSYKEKVSPMV